MYLVTEGHAGLDGDPSGVLDRVGVHPTRDGGEGHRAQVLGRRQLQRRPVLTRQNMDIQTTIDSMGPEVTRGDPRTYRARRKEVKITKKKCTQYLAEC